MGGAVLAAAVSAADLLMGRPGSRPPAPHRPSRPTAAAPTHSPPSRPRRPRPPPPPPPPGRRAPRLRPRRRDPSLLGQPPPPPVVDRRPHAPHRAAPTAMPAAAPASSSNSDARAAAGTRRRASRTGLAMGGGREQAGRGTPHLRKGPPVSLVARQPARHPASTAGAPPRPPAPADSEHRDHSPSQKEEGARGQGDRGGPDGVGR